MAAIHTPAHKVIHGCVWKALNNKADTRSRRLALSQLNSWFPAVPSVNNTNSQALDSEEAQ